MLRRAKTDVLKFPATGNEIELGFEMLLLATTADEGDDDVVQLLVELKKDESSGTATE